MCEDRWLNSTDHSFTCLRTTVRFKPPSFPLWISVKSFPILTGKMSPLPSILSTCKYFSKGVFTIPGSTIKTTNNGQHFLKSVVFLSWWHPSPLFFSSLFFAIHLKKSFCLLQENSAVFTKFYISCYLHIYWCACLLFRLKDIFSLCSNVFLVVDYFGIVLFHFWQGFSVRFCKDKWSFNEVKWKETQVNELFSFGFVVIQLSIKMQMLSGILQNSWTKMMQTTLVVCQVQNWIIFIFCF